MIKVKFCKNKNLNTKDYKIKIKDVNLKQFL